MTIGDRAQSYLVRSRSNYQLRHFVIGQHDTPEMQFRQILIEAKHLYHRITEIELELQMEQLKIDRLEASGDPMKLLKAQKRRLNKNAVEESLITAREELDYLLEMSREYKHYTKEEIEAAQPRYWELRLTRQAELDQKATESGVNVGNLTSMLQAGLLRKEIEQ